MTPAETLNTLIALKLHFTSSYDFIKYNGKLRQRVDYAKRNDKFQIQKIARHPDAFGLILSNVLEKPNLWTGDIVTDEGYRIHTEWMKRNESLSYVFKQDLKKFELPLVDNFKVSDGQHPKALRMYIGEKICLETLVILNSLFKYYDHWSSSLKDDLVWKALSYKIPKYQPFVKFDKMRMKKIVNEHVKSDNS